MNSQALNEKRPFAEGVNFYKLVWVFTIGCVVGFIVETIWCLAKTGVIESRKGLIYGPFSPVYGFGAILFTLILYKIRNKNVLFIFFSSAVLGAFFEYVCSIVQEKIVGTISWEYSSEPFNLNGRTSLSYAFLWGILGTFFIRHIYTAISKCIEKIPNKFGIFLTWSIFIIMCFDLLISSAAVKRQTLRHHGVPPGNQIEKFIDETYTDEYLKEVYPNMIMNN